MAQLHEFFSAKMQDNEGPDLEDWERDWTSWELATTSPAEIPTEFWHYTAAPLGSGDLGPSCYPSASPITSNIPSLVSSNTNSPIASSAQCHGRPVTQMTRPEQHVAPYKQPQTYIKRNFDDQDVAGEDSDRDHWQVRRLEGPRQTHGLPLRSVHRRTKSSNEMMARDAKRAHTAVERNYRERLNDKIAELGLYLFETSSDSRTKPSKSLIMTRAKERLQKLDARNKTLEAEVVQLRQHIAILDHIVASKGD